MKIIIINGQGGSGKDTFVKFCKKHSTRPIFNISMIDGVKKIAEQIGWTGGKDLKDRKFLSDLKDLLNDYNDFPFNDTLHTLRVLYNASANKEFICFIHARELEDILRWGTLFNITTVLIERQEIKGNYGNHADDEVYNIDYDYVIRNDSSLEALEEEAKKFITKINEPSPWGDNYIKLP